MNRFTFKPALHCLGIALCAEGLVVLACFLGIAAITLGWWR